MRKRRKDVVRKGTFLLGLVILCHFSAQFLRRFLLIPYQTPSEGKRFDTVECNTSHTGTVRSPTSIPAAPVVHFVSTTICPGLSAPRPEQQLSFQPVRGSDSFVYSAHLEEDYVTVIALVRNKVGRHGSLYCQIWHNTKGYGDPLRVVDAQVEPINESHGRRYVAGFIKCPLGALSQRKSNVEAVSVISGQKCQSGNNKAHPLAVTSPPSADGKLTSEFTVCVSPLNLRYSRAYELVEMVEFNKILGADKLVFYNFSIGPNVDQVLQMYTKLGDVDVLPWHVPIHVDSWPPNRRPSEVWYFGQLAALNDCLLRYKHRARYLVFSDLDEFIVPLEDTNWRQLVARLHTPPADSEKTRHLRRRWRDRNIFIFQCTFFRKEWPQPLHAYKSISAKLKSAVLGYTLRETHVLPAGSRSKMIVNPRSVQEVGVHQVWQGESSLVVPSTVGLLYHYRSWETPNQKVDLITSNDVALRFGDRLATKLQETWNRLPGVLMDIDIKSYGDSIS